MLMLRLQYLVKITEGAKMANAENSVKKLLGEPLDAVMTIRLGVSSRLSLREIATYYGSTEQDIIRRFVAILANVFEDAKSQAALGGSFDELLSRATRLGLVHFMDMSPVELRRMADEFSRAAYALANVIEGLQKKSENRKGRK